MAEERLWCTACGTVTRNKICDCNCYGVGHEMYREPNFVKYTECHCGKDGHALGSINCPVHGLPFAAIDNLTHHQEQCDVDGVMVRVSRQALDEVLRYLATQSPADVGGPAHD